MKMAKASERDIDAAGDAMSVLNDISSGYYPARDGDEAPPFHFDPDDTEHLRRFYQLMNATLDAAPGWPGRVIGGMCYVILFDKNEIVDPAADTLEIHPRFDALQTQRDELLAALKAMLDEDDGGRAADQARAVIAKAEASTEPQCAATQAAAAAGAEAGV